MEKRQTPADLDLHGGQLFIGGEWTAPASDDELEVISACTEEKLARVPAACAADMDRAVAAARNAFDKGHWPRMRPHERAEKLRALSASLGLHGAVFTNGTDRAYQIARQVRTGNFGHNCRPIEPGFPFGGFKQSGIGREGGLEGVDQYVELKSVYLAAVPSGLMQ